MTQNVDGRVTNKIHQLVGEGVQNVREMARYIRICVKNELLHGSSIPPSTNHRFNPTPKDVTNHTYKAAAKHKFSKLDQADLDFKAQEWKQQECNLIMIVLPVVMFLLIFATILTKKNVF